MNAANFHLAVNHLPIIFPIVGLIILILGIVIKSDVVKRTAYFIFLLGAIFTLVAAISGEKAHEFVKNFDWADKEFIEKHEETAVFFAISNYVLGLISAIGIWANYKGKKFAKILLIIVFLISIFVMTLALATGKSGGEIRHTETRSEQTSQVDLNPENSYETTTSE